MKPIDAARAMYHREPCGRCFGDDLAIFQRIGYVFSTPTAFLMGKPIVSPERFETAAKVTGMTPLNDASLRFLYTLPDYEFSSLSCDTWLIWLAAGDMRDFFRFEPHPMKFVAWARKGRIRFHEFNRVKSRVLCKISTASSIFPPSAQMADRSR